MTASAQGWRLILFAPLLFISVARPAVSQPAPIAHDPRLGILTDNYPFSFRGPDGRMEGFACDLLREIEGSMGLRFERIVGNTAEINGAFRTGGIEVLQSYARYPERESVAGFSVPYLTMEGAIFVREGSPGINTLADLKGRRVLVHQGSVGEILLQKAGLADAIMHVESVEQALIAVDRGDGDVTLATRLTGLAVAHQLGLKHLRALNVKVEGYNVDYCVAVRKGDDLLLARINEGMALLVRTGKFDELYKKWFGFVAPVGFTREQILMAIAGGLALALAVAGWAMARQRVLQRSISAQAELVRESEARYRQLLALAPVGISVYADGRVVFINQAGARLLGAESPEQIIGREAFDLLHPSRREEARRRIEKSSLGMAGVYPAETTYVKLDGSLLEAEIMAAPVVYAGRPATQVVVMDLTARKQAEAEARLLNQRLTLATDAAAIGVWEWDLKTDQMYCTATCFTMLGETPEKGGAARQRWFARVHPLDQPAVREKLEAVMHGDDAPYHYESRMRHADGSYRWVYSSGHVLERDEQGKAVRVLGVRLDFTDRKEAELALLAREEQLSVIYQNVHDVLFVVGVLPDGDFRLVSVNRRFLDVTGYKESQVLGVRVTEALPASLHSLVLENYRQAIRTRRPASWEETTDYPSGRKIIVTTISPVFDAQDQCTQLIGTMHDITDQKRIEEEIRAASEQLRALAARLHSVREQECTAIAREIHDVPAQELTRLKIDLVWLAKRVAQPMDETMRPVVATRVADAIAQADTAISTVQRIATELRPVILDSLGLPAAIEWQTEDFSRRTGIACAFCVPREETTLARDQATAIFRILQESLTNVARHARASGVEVEFTEEEHVATLTVRDNGAGITREQMNDPRSIGLLGMSERALAFGGTVEIRGSPGAGTTVIVRLPIESAAPTAL